MRAAGACECAAQDSNRLYADAISDQEAPIANRTELPTQSHLRHPKWQKISRFFLKKGLARHAPPRHFLRFS